MKKIKCVFLVIVLGFTIGVTSGLSVNEKPFTVERFYSESDEITSEISEISGIKDEIAKYAKLNPDDIDLNDMYKLYTEADKILTENLTGKQALDILNESDYLWVLPISSNDINVTFTFHDGKVNSYADDYYDKRYKETVCLTESFSTDKTTDGIIYFIDFTTLRTSAGVIITEDENYIKCFNEGINHYSDDEIELSKDYLPQSEIVELVKKWENDGLINRNKTTPWGDILYG